MSATTSPAVPLFFAAGAGAFAGLLGASSPLPLALLAAVLAAAALASKAPLGRALALVVLTATLAAAAGAHQRARAAFRTASLPQELAVLEGTVADIAFGATGNTRLFVDVTGALVAGAPRALSARVEVVALPGVGTDVAPGDRVRARGVARPYKKALSPGELDMQKLALARGLDARLVVAEPFDIAVVERAARAAPFAHLRLALRERLSALLTPRLAGLVLALLVGDTSHFDDAQRELYRRVGAGHLLAVSGLQVSLIALLLERLALVALMATSLGRRGRGRALASAAALFGVWSFVLLCGAPPSAVRAGAMASAVLLAALVGRRSRGFDAIGIAGLGTVLLSPASVLDPSFLLSYGAVLGLAASTARDAAIADDVTQGASLLRRIADVAIASVGAGLVTLPVSAWLFGEVAPAGLVANIVLVPVATLVQVPALALGLLGALLDVAWIAWLGGQSALLLEALAAGLGDLLPGTRPVPAPSGLVAALLVACALAFAAALARRRLRLTLAPAVAAAVVLAVAAHEPRGVRIAVLPVGQGDGAVFELPDGTVLLVDAGGSYRALLEAPSGLGPAGASVHDPEVAPRPAHDDPGARVVLPFLARRGIDAIDVMMVSHPHPDHAAGLVSVARAVPVRELWHAGASMDGALLGALARALPATTRVRSTPELLGAHRFGDTVIEVLAPAPAERTATYPELGANDNSLVVRVCHAGACALWPGDIEVFGEELLLAPSAAAPGETGRDVRAQVVKAPHHGSRSSSTAPFVAATRAEHVVFCTGPDNAFGFPHADVIERWRASGARLWDTAIHGELTIFLTASGATVRGFDED